MQIIALLLDIAMDSFDLGPEKKSPGSKLGRCRGGFWSLSVPNEWMDEWHVREKERLYFVSLYLQV